MTPDADLTHRVRAVLAKTLDLPSEALREGVDGLRGAGLGVDSIDSLRVLAALEEEFDITIDETQLEASAFDRLDTIIALVRRFTRGVVGHS